MNNIKKIIGYILSILGTLIFLSLYFLTVIFKNNDNIAIIIMGAGYISIVSFIIGIMLIKKQKNSK